MECPLAGACAASGLPCAWAQSCANWVGRLWVRHVDLRWRKLAEAFKFSRQLHCRLLDMGSIHSEQQNNFAPANLKKSTTSWLDIVIRQRLGSGFHGQRVARDTPSHQKDVARIRGRSTWHCVVSASQIHTRKSTIGHQTVLYSGLRRMIVVLCPPKPNELDMA